MANARMYSLFYRDGKRWVRVEGAGQYSLQQARRIFQDRLINSVFSNRPLSLRPVKGEQRSDVVPPASQRLCKPCEDHLHAGCSKGNCACNCWMFNG